ncbi:MetQ/NlpA family ABC transporter substrate-binding protein [Cellulomonas fimi]|uniref:NLPA lipoprotein n=1 Tax=Cellulomonas fimi (strain ATCC 484 / DSM 20113 / JCM 1341 / CCUG 24087 / LMG 16345 / NBRC 15513 / NCIMB 8980 / NCTC 7547 / NRS-133) TaxID=590998 RepID=F4H3C4_CELFA|nr:MetQ/NlpA family ABC transporter substrate-binding protein [Cellulomonas fimi]AEE45345.1 NLPA lipoprotein [Cellulomonas fimi ATCC 484]NNH08175.1 metal ABC transporter substrate-binding protein [Cellulomonas fimi]VEH29044.1 D-methionine-binding lipoprotein metQ precursor [Cellulomonas fimi]
MSENVPVLPAKNGGGRRTGLVVGAVVAVVVLVAALVFALTRPGTDDAAAAEEGATVVRLGTTDVAQPHWEILTELAAEEGIDLEIVGFSEYTQPNPALTEDEIDLNAFQHILYLADHNNNTGDDLQPIGSTLIVPLPLYSEKHEDVSEFTKGEQVAIPNDATNQARALFVLEEAGLITFTGEPKVPTPDDVDTEKSTVVVRPVEASQTAGLISDPDIAGVIVNNNFATDAGFDLDGYVFADDPSSQGAQPYINVIAARPDDVDNPAYQKIVELYHDPKVLESVVESSGGTAVIVEGYDAAKLKDVLAETQENLKAAG